MSDAVFSGCFSLLVTPLQSDGTVDLGCCRALAQWHAASGVQGLFAVCGTSEMAHLSLQERLAVAEAAVLASGGIPVVAAANLEPPGECQGEELRRMAATGVAAVVLVPPRQRAQGGDLYAYLRAGCGGPVPALLYEWPGSADPAIPAEVYGRLVSECGVRGIKDTTCTPEGVAAKLAAAPGATVFQANNPLLIDALDAGARGMMTITSAVRPDLLAALWRHHRSGRREQAQACWREIVFLDAVLAANHPAGAKWLLRRQGLGVSLATRSGRPLSAAEKASLEAWAAGAPPVQRP